MKKQDTWHRTPAKRYLPLVWMLFAGLASCGRPPEIHYYTIQVQPDPGASTNHTAVYPFIAGVIKLDGGLLYSDDRIIYRQSPFEVKFWNYRRWIAPPNVLATEALREHLKVRHLFEDVVGYPSTVRPKMVFSGKVAAFEEWDDQTGWHGKVGLHLSLTDLQQDRVVWQGQFEAMKPVAQKMPSAVVESINKALNQCLQEAIDDLEKALVSQMMSKE
ncbi:MAG: hypothetical protein D6814_16580 [Calditrichaeota bacterium]|nr:MAG: hypothetical protein D6814_16580 [Calditrichota bacterium]